MNGWGILAGIAALALFFVMLPVAGCAYARFRAARRLRCPETGADVDVTVDARHAALTAAFTHPPRLRVADCSLWPERHACAEGCLNGEGGPATG